MKGITKIEIPEIEGLRETFAESAIMCSEPGINCPTGGADGL